MYFAHLKAELKKRGNFSVEKVEKAYTFAEKAHKGQMRKTGEEYITHPIAVAQRLVQLGADEESIIAALLHDTVEDTSVTLKEVEKKFGKKVAELVDGLTKFEKNTFDGKKELDEKIETIRKWLLAVKIDLRIAIIKIADRLDNLSSLGIFRPDKRARIAKETLDIYARIAKWLSMEEVRQELEYYSFPHILEEEKYTELEQQMQTAEKKQKDIVEKIKKELKKYKKTEVGFMKIKEHMISAQELYFSPSLPLSAYCIVPSKKECYQALSFLHEHWHRKKGTFQDYINTPKINGYQALHTTLVLDEGAEIKIKIMTEEMFEYYLHGALTFCFSKEKRKKKKLPWVEKMEQLLENNKEKSYEFWRGVQSDLLMGFIVVYGPKGKSITLPQNSTYLDATFSFLGKDALYVSAITSNGKQIPQRRQIPDGVRIEFAREKTPQVQYDWLNDVDNVQSIQAIKEFLRDRKRKEKVESGKVLLQAEFDAHKMGIVDEIEEKVFLIAYQDEDIHSSHDLFIKIAEVQILPSEVIARIAPEKTKDKRKESEEFSLTCEVRKDRLTDFSAIASKYIIRSEVNSYRENKNLFRVYLECSAPQEKKERLMRDIRRHRGMRIAKIHRTKQSNMLSWAILIFLSTLWGIGLVTADYLIEYENIDPMLFSTSRLWTVTMFMVVILAIESKRKREVSKPINITHWSFYASALCFMGIPIFTYLALAHATPSQYVLFMITHSILVLFITMAEKRCFDFRFMIPIILLLATGSYFFIINNPGFDPLGKILILLSVLSFGGYSYTSSYYAKKLKVKLRYPQFLASIAFLGAMICTVIYGISLKQFPTYEHLLYTSVYSVIFPGIAYLLYYVFINRRGYSSMIGYSFFMFLAVTYICQIFFLHKPIYIAEWIALPFLSLAVLFGVRYLEKINATENNNRQNTLP